MRTVYLIFGLLAIFLLSCHKSSDVRKEKVEDVLNETTRFDIAIKNREFRTHYKSLVSLIEGRKITFRSFRDSVQRMLNNPKYLRSAINRYPFGQTTLRAPFYCESPDSECYWTYVPQGCPFPEENCNAWHLSECYSHCESKYYYSSAAIAIMEVGAEQQYTNDTTFCNFHADADAIRTCKEMALMNYENEWEIINQKTWLLNDGYRKCEVDCRSAYDN